LKIYSHFGIYDFIICCGCKGYAFKEYFANYFLHTSDVIFDRSANAMEVNSRKAEPWRVTLVDTGDATLTGGRLRRVREHIGDETFYFTDGDGVADADLHALIDFHHRVGRRATLTAVQPPGRFGSLAFERGRVLSFEEEPQGDGSWINGGFFVRDPSVMDRVASLVNEVRPQVVLHLAAQPLVRLSYAEPTATWATNVMGSIHLLEALRRLQEPCKAGGADPHRQWCTATTSGSTATAKTTRSAAMTQIAAARRRRNWRSPAGVPVSAAASRTRAPICSSPVPGPAM